MARGALENHVEKFASGSRSNSRVICQDGSPSKALAILKITSATATEINALINFLSSMRVSIILYDAYALFMDFLLPEPIFSSALPCTAAVSILYRTRIVSPAKIVYQTMTSFLQ